MLFTSILFLAAGASAIMVPRGADAADGVYEVSTVNGQEVHTLVNTTLSSAITSREPIMRPRSAKFGKRQDANHVTCGRQVLDVDSTNAANANLDAQCDTGAIVGPQKSFYSKQGSTVAFFCNYNNPISTVCTSADRAIAADEINAQCGGFVAGYDFLTDAGATYGWQDVNICFCFC